MPRFRPVTLLGGTLLLCRVEPGGGWKAEREHRTPRGARAHRRCPTNSAGAGAGALGRIQGCGVRD